MTPFLKWLNEKMKNVDEFYEVDEEVGENNENEEIIAELDDELRRLYTVMHNHFEKIKKKRKILVENGPFGIPDEEIKELSWMMSRDELLTDLFWEEVRTLTNNPSKSLGIRKGFKIVTFEQKEKPDLSPFGGRIILAMAHM